MAGRIWTIGHSNRSAEEFLRLLRRHGIQLVVDVRRFPSSRWSHFGADALRDLLRNEGIEYLHLEGLGGFRGGYESYMETAEFREALEALMSTAKGRETAIMCAESLFFRCHRRFIADALVERGWEVLHIMDERRVQRHRVLERVDPRDRNPTLGTSPSRP